MKKIILSMIAFLAIEAGAQCRWSKTGIYYTNRCKTYTFEMGSYLDSCVKYTTQIFNFKTKQIDTFYGRIFNTTFKDTGTYKVYVKVFNPCKKCDTVIYKIIKVDCLGSINTNTLNENKLILTPNPVNVGFELNINGITPYEIFNTSGEIVHSGILNENKYICVELLGSGYYYIKTNRGIQSFIIQR